MLLSNFGLPTEFPKKKGTDQGWAWADRAMHGPGPGPGDWKIIEKKVGRP
jgi:hypothetical protein